MKRVFPLLLVLLGALLPAHAARAGGPTMLVGVAEDTVKQDSLVAAKARMDLLALAGFDAVRVSSIWAPGRVAPTATEQAQLRNVASAAALDGIRVLVSVTNFGSGTTPLTEQDRADFAAYAAAIARANPTLRDFVVGNEPNLNRFWLPQFDGAGGDAAASAYEALLAETYDALKAVSPEIRVLGGAVSPRGVDRPGTGRDTHSPTAFIADLGAAYRASGRTLPIMDALAFHPYEDNSSLPPSFQHPQSTTIALADYSKLVGLLATAFDGTAQPGSTLPILYDEFGVETGVPPERAAAYAGVEPRATKPVDEATQGAYYTQALQLAFCQPNVAGTLLFHLVDETDLDRWQSGLYYADGTAKSDLPVVQAAVRATRGGVIASCPGLELTPRAVGLAYPRGPGLKARRPALLLTCDIDCTYRVRLERLPAHSTTRAAGGHAFAGRATRVALPPVRLAPGSYRFTVRLTAPANPGPPFTAASAPFRVESTR